MERSGKKLSPRADDEKTAPAGLAGAYTCYGVGLAGLKRQKLTAYMTL